MSSTITCLQQAVEGLFFPSEADAPFEPFFWPSEETRLTEKTVREFAKAADDALVARQSVDEFFEPAIEEADWQNYDERAEAKKFQHLLQVLDDLLEDLRVYRVGETCVDIYIVGKTEDGFAGVRTKVVET